MMVFQSLVGFKINWNMIREAIAIDFSLFQSLVGFKINWNADLVSGKTLIRKFQSLVGFKINWNFSTNKRVIVIIGFNP
ncbi:diguanylate cyclase/phosphodiesterase (GGDEF & EAL domains) with PAS/PAC sensor(s) [Microcystis aeruginosa NIES-98]|nr:diguanylate cyclase/phosphodiesterase (GGDEF & EAL domains) with PAS/PAC sensor(s) [Microcystis aeruginosa NIES-98]